MNKITTPFVAAMAAFGLSLFFGGGYTASAQDVSLVSYNELANQYNEVLQRLGELESRQDAMERLPTVQGSLRFASMGPAPAEEYAESTGCCGGCCGTYAQYENVFVKPFFTDGVAFNTLNGNNLTEFPFDWNLEYSSRFEIGCNSECGFGWRARYWRLDNETVLTDTQANIFAGFADDHAEFDSVTGTIRAAHSVELDVVDLEGVYNECCTTYSVGMRYVRMDQTYTGTIAARTITGTHDFEGIGPTMSAEKRLPCLFGLSLFSNVRTSLLYGDSTAAAFESNSTDRTLRRNEGDLIGIGEMQVGADWRRETCYGLLFFTTALEAQYWLSAGTSTPSTVEDDDPSYQDEGAQSADMGFFGGTIRIGILR